MNRKSYFKLISVLLAILITFVMMYYLTYEASHAIHHCTGVNCPICHELHIAELITTQISSAIVTKVKVLFFAIYCQKIITVILCLFQERNLITDKVRMDD